MLEGVTDTGRHHRKTHVWLIVGVTVVVCCVGGGALGYFFGIRPLIGATGPARQAAEAFITDLEDSPPSAYDTLCAATRQAFTPEQFVEIVNNRRPFAHGIVGVNTSNSGGRVTVTVVASVTYTDGLTERHGFPLIKEGGVWKVCGKPY
jgi:hypothetical protein